MYIAVKKRLLVPLSLSSLYFSTIQKGAKHFGPQHLHTTLQVDYLEYSWVNSQERGEKHLAQRDYVHMKLRYENLVVKDPVLRDPAKKVVNVHDFWKQLDHKLHGTRY